MNPKFKKLAHLFAHRKDGAQRRFRKEYIDQRDRVQIAWMADLATMEANASKMFKSNQALAQNRLDRQHELMNEEARNTLRIVFTRFRAEIERIAVELGGHPQDDGNIVFPDASVARMPKGLYIPPEEQLRFEQAQ